ncbi:MAG: SDR family NAD(P)-dependent oxidoreductase, partial [Hyphomicrobiales bacterium]
MTDITRRSLLSSAAATTAATAMAATPLKAEDVMIPVSYKLSGAVLITGCSTGFGRLAAEELARAGAKVFATMRNLPRKEAAELIAI